MGRTSDSETLSIHTKREIISEIVSRGEALDKKKGSFGALVLEWWWKSGCPPVSEADRLVQISKAGKLKKSG